NSVQKNNDTVTHNGRGAKFSDTKYVSVLFILLFYSCVCPFYFLTSDPNAQGIELSADAGLNASNASGTMSGQLQLGKAEALVQPQNGTVSGKTEGAKVTGTLSSNPTSVNNEGKVKVGAHMGLIKVELEVDTNKLD
ncbi:hypothetical protein H5183_21415, partial [Pseudoalteromonas sp. SR44-8]|uniref:hypothetical protein n=1 Tax=Pseudoalteromonas sp. SR44-8 TaxID=2760933 RepID=UPI0015FF8F46